ncbi:MAG: hypothetical protein IT384_14380 [Deltaproteobacteria bacterium]|nr:hypothetical protein [Deltaproteobacteria bacterium]
MILALGVALAQAACSGPPCRTQADCATGSYCFVEVSGVSVDGTCLKECELPEDCPNDDPATHAPLCDERGHCRIVTRPPRVRVLDPEYDSLLPEGTRQLRLSGEVETAADKVTIDVTPVGSGACMLGETRRIVLENSQPGQQATLAFVLDNISVDPGLSVLEVRASVIGASDRLEHIVEIPCPGCPQIIVDLPPAPMVPKEHVPPQPYAAPGLVLPRLEGRFEPPGAPVAIWRVFSERGDVFDGLMAVDQGRFLAEKLPLFAGYNRVQVLLTGAGEGLGENRCSRPVTAATPVERGLRALLTWDGRTADLDLHLVAPSGRFGDPATSLSSRSTTAVFGGEVDDDFDGLGPETLSVPQIADGTYGVVVEPVFDDRDPGSNAFLRVLHDGRPLTPGPVGPVFLSAVPGELWIVGLLHVQQGVAELEILNDRLPVSSPPARSPAEWPQYD